uniref:NB-ARC domain-containing protein n=1 Tax=Cyanothece sp. (strain PCC 7425 / ATCC 29141) TaxID=395961 RepID=B8HJN9_CYAP4
MTDTVQALQRVSDGDFEKLAAFFLRRQHSDCAGLIATGINEDEKPVACPVDGITYIDIPGRYSRCIALAATTFKMKDVRRKWLGGKNYKGDIEKANEEFQKWRQDDPNIECILFLAINRFLKNDTDLYRESIRLGKLYNIRIEIIEASILIDFLDNNPDGEYIREEILGIKAERISKDLLRKISETSLCEHQRVFGKEQAKEIIRELCSPVLDLVEKPNVQLIGLRGASGIGKSTLLRQVGKRLNTCGDIAIWVSNDLVESSDSLIDLLSKVLKRFEPTLDESAASEALHIISSVSCKLVLLIDDINRSSNPLNLIKTLESLVKNQKNDFLTLIIPLWAGQLSARPETKQKQKNIFWEEIELNVFSSNEKKILLNQLNKGSLETAFQIIDNLNGDPFLCGIALESEEAFLNVNTSNLIKEIFTRFLEQVAESSREMNPYATRKEFITAIDELIELIILTNDPEPQWEQVHDKLNNRKDLLQVVAVKNKIGWIDHKYGFDFWRWKHDKIRDALVGRWLANKILIQLAQETSVTQDQEKLLSNLGLAEAWAFSLVFLGKKSEQEKAVSVLAKYQPLALAELLRLNLFPERHEVNQLAAKHLRQILFQFIEQIKYRENIVRQLIFEKLAQTNNLAVLQATEELQGNDYVWAGRFRNGDIAAAIEWINHEMNGGQFLPNINHPMFEQALERFMATYSCNRGESLQKILEAMEQLETAIAAITLAGYLTWTELAEPVWNIWDSLSDKQKLIATVPTIWALSRCGNSSMQDKLEQVLLFTHQLRQADEELRRQDEPGYIPEGIEFFWRIACQIFEPTLRWSITPLGAETWVKVVDENAEIHKWMWDKLRYIDHPIAIETYIRHLVVKTMDDSDNIGIRIMWEGELSEGFNDPLRQMGVPKQPYKNSATCIKLWEIVENDLDFRARLMAFLLWKRGVSVNDLEKLQSISVDNEIFDEVLKVRLKLHDKTAARALIQKLHTKPRYWCAYVPFLQNTEEVFDTFLDTFDAALEIPPLELCHHILNSVAKYLSVERVRELVGKKHELLMNSPQTWLALWCSDVPEALKLVQEAMVQSDLGAWYLFFFPNESFHDQISQRMLNALTPVLQKHPSIRECIAERAADAGFGEWVHEHLPDVAGRERIRYFFPTSEDINGALALAIEKEADGERPIQLTPELHSVRTAFRRRDKLESVVNLQSVFESWISSAENEKQLVLVARLLAAWGDSRDIVWWQKLKLAEPFPFKIWMNTLQVLKRRRWHGVGEFTAMA